MGEEKIQEAIKPEPIVPKRAILIISILYIIVFKILLEDSFFSMIFSIIILTGAIKEIFEKEKKKKIL